LKAWFNFMHRLNWKLAKIPLIYLIIGSVWIYFSDYMFQFLSETIHEFAYLQTIKGIAYVFFTSILLYVLIYWQYSALMSINSQLIEKETTLKNLFDNLPGMVYRAKMNDNFTIEFVSENCASVTGYTPEEMNAAEFSFSEIILPDDLPFVKQSIDKAVSEKRSFELTYRIKRKTGEIAWVWEKGSGVFDQKNKFLYLEGIIIDVTEQVKDKEFKEELQKQFYQAQKMESIGRLSSGIAHDFNNLLTVIEGHTSLLLHDLPEDNPQRNIIEQIQKAGNKASKLIRQLLAFSKKVESKTEKIDLNQTLDEMQMMISRIIRSNIKLVFHKTPEPTPILIDRTHLEQILLNLIVNAQDAMEKGGILTIETSLETIDDDETNDPNLPNQSGIYVLLLVCDTGIGMTQDVMEKIFEPFFTTKEADRGTGLGLSTVYGIVQQNGGTITVDSQPNIGTVFRIYFPKA